MQYVKFPNLGIKVSRFGMGCMRFPNTVDSKGNSIIDEAESIRMVRHAAENGVNYFDNAYVYEGSEKILGKALSGGWREKVMIATKSPVYEPIIERPEDFDKILDIEMERLQTDYIDFYLFHYLTEKSWKKINKLGLIKKLDGAKKDGRIKYTGFSFHDNLDLFKEIIDSYKWNMCQIQLNYMGESWEAGVEGLKYAASKGMGVVIMEPLLGGLLGENVPQDIVDKWNQSGTIRTPADWAFRWLGNFPEVTIVLSGVSAMYQLKENIEIFKNALPNSLTKKELGAFEGVRKLYKSKIKVGCTGCAYCLPCSSEVNIPAIFLHYNNTFMGDPATSKDMYKSWLCAEKIDASQCTECGECEEVCPQNIPIIDRLKDAHKHLLIE